MTDLLPDEAEVRWQPHDLTIPCAALRETRGEIRAPWPLCRERPTGPGRVCRNLPGIDVPTSRSEVGTPRRLATRAGTGDVEVTLVHVSPGTCTTPGAATREHRVRVIFGVRPGDPLVAPVTAGNFRIEGPDGSVDADAGAVRCDPETGGPGRPLGTVREFLFDTRHDTGTLVFEHPELTGSARWAFTAGAG